MSNGYMSQSWGTSAIPAQGSQAAPPPPWKPLEAVATTGTAGVALGDSTPNILTWTAPADGALHRVVAFLDYLVTTAATGGEVNLQFTDPAGNFQSRELVAGGGSAGFQTVFAPGYYLVQAGETVYLAQTTALTAGAARVWAELWAS